MCIRDSSQITFGAIWGSWVRSNYTFMGIFGIHFGISRITFSEHKFRGLSELFRSLSITSKLVHGQKLQRLSWNGWNLFFFTSALFRTFFSPFLLFLTLCFRIRAFHRKYVLSKGDLTTLQRRGSTEPNSLRYGPSKLALHFGVRIRSNFTFMGIFGIHIGISRITFSKHKFRGLSELFRSLSIIFRDVDGQKLQRLSWNGWKSVSYEGALFRTYFHIFVLSRPVFSNKGFPQKLRIV